MSDTPRSPFKKLLVANRSEIAIRVFRSAHELGIRTVAIYSHEDRFALHRFKADEAYRVGKPGEPIRAYLDIPGIVAAREGSRRRRDPPRLRLPVRERRVRPGLRRGRDHLRRPARRSPRPARRQGRGPRHRQEGRRAGPLRQRRAGGVDRRGQAARGEARLPGHRQGVDGRRRPRHARRLTSPTSSTRRSTRPGARPAPRSASPTSSSKSSSQRAKHIEVQLLGDQHGNLVHLFERDCSIQRRHQKVVEIAPAPNLDRRRAPGHPRRRARGRPGRAASTTPAPSSSWSTPTPSKFYFIEVNPRIQVEHTVTESHRLRPRQVPDPHRPGPAARTIPEIGLEQSGDHARTASRSSAGSRPRTRPTASCPTTAGSAPTARPAAWASGSTPARPSPARSSRRSTTRCW